MSSSASVTVAAGGGGDGYRPPFTAVQWQELVHQALIYKYLAAGVPVPSDLVIPIRRSLEALSARFFHHPTLGYCSYYGKKFDPEPGRCRRTDGKKWRCSKDAYPDSKYCERHMHRGRNRSRKPVESQSTTTQSLSTAISNISTVSNTGGGNGSYQSVSSGSFQNLPFYPIASSETLSFGNDAPKLQDTSAYGINNKDYRYAHGVAIDVDDQNYSSGASTNTRGLGMESNVDNTWRLMPTQVPSSSMLKPSNDSYSQINSPQLNMASAFDPMLDGTCMSKQRQQQQQHCFFGGDLGSPVQVKHEQHSMRPFFDEWPKARETWSDLDADSKSSFSTTQLSMSMAPSEFTARNSCPQNDA